MSLRIRLFLMRIAFSSRSGSTMTPIAFSLILSLILLRVASGQIKKPMGAARVGVLLALVGIPCLMIGLTALSFHAFLTIPSLLICLFLKAPQRAIVAFGICAMITSYGTLIWSNVDQLKVLEEYRRQTPMESLEGRLAYEQTTRGPVVSASAGVPPSHSLSDQIEQQLVSQSRIRVSGRAVELERLHDHYYDDFVMAEGFGVLRMLKFRPSRLTVSDPDLGPILTARQSSGNPTDEQLTDGVSPNAIRIDSATPGRNGLFEAHFAGWEDFHNPQRIGYIKDRTHVAGFQSHRYTKRPKLQTSESSSPMSWQLVRLDLISILKHAEPVAYVSEHLPRMDELVKAPTRSLTDFERESLVTLRYDEDLVIAESGGRIQMVGSLRAGDSCLKCHLAKRGELLGALSYELVATSMSTE